ncbi:MAG: septum formation initiator family protein [Paracoccaceae bacterium]|jgi:cell division protein FtsB|nr:septum formation initiator precursor [Marinovum sp.]|tara:strand:- start:388 stop:690 length:303 start_codon:yes stop_codon:yes gene_type:complete
MAETRSSIPWVIICVFTISLSLGIYFTFAAVQGDFGILRRAEINHDLQKLQVEIGSINVEIADLKNLTRRLSDHYLDLELLDQQARDVLGYVRTDELVIQ